MASVHTTKPGAPMTANIPRTAEGKVITSLKNRYHFPTVVNAPHENEVPEDYFGWDFGADDELHPCPKKHWAYLGEITRIMRITRLVLTTRDMAGKEIPIAFYLKNRNGVVKHCNPNLSLYENRSTVEDGVRMAVGQTIVVVYPEMHGFLDQSTGIKLESEGRMDFKVGTSRATLAEFNPLNLSQILPYSLNELLKANDTIVSQKLLNFEAKCDHCKKNIGRSLHCGRCQVSYYCNRVCTAEGLSPCVLQTDEAQDCQTADWKPNPGSSPPSPGHQYMCKLYREVKWFSDRDWDDYTPHQKISFPRPVSGS